MKCLIWIKLKTKITWIYVIQLIKLLDETINQYRKVKLNMKKLTTIIILLSLASLTACHPLTKEEILDKNGTDTSNLDYKTITLKDGRKLECVEFSNGNRYGISCNWNNPVNQNIK